MNKHLNNWLDKAEGKAEGSSNKGIEKERVRQGYDKKKSMAKKIGKKKSNFESLVSMRDTKQELRKEHDYWKNIKGPKNIKITSRPDTEKDVYNTRVEVRKGY